MLDINIWEIVLYIVNIVILFFFLRWLLYKPISKFLKNRSDGIQKQLSEAAKKHAEAEQMKAKYEEMMRDAESLSAEIVRRGKTLADSQAEQIIKDASDQADAMRRQANRYIEEEKRQAVLEMRSRITDIAMQLAEKVLEREVSVEDNRRIIDNFFEKVS